MLRSDQNTVAGAWTDPRATASVAPPANPPAPASNSSRGWCRALDARLKHSYRTLRLRARDGTGRASPPRRCARAHASRPASGPPACRGPTYAHGRSPRARVQPARSRGELARGHWAGGGAAKRQVGVRHQKKGPAGAGQVRIRTGDCAAPAPEPAADSFEHCPMSEFPVPRPALGRCPSPSGTPPGLLPDICIMKRHVASRAGRASRREMKRP